MDYLKKITLAFITIFLGSFIFVGVLENYKSSETIKTKQLESYYLPARESITKCLSLHNELYLHYPNNWTSLETTYQQFKRIASKGNMNISTIEKAILHSFLYNLFDVIKVQGELSEKVENCRLNVVMKLEILSIITGSFEYYSKEVSERNSLLNELDKQYRKDYKILTSRFGVVDVQEIVDSLFEMDSIKSADEMLLMLEEFKEIIPFVRESSLLTASVEQKKYEIDSDFYDSIRLKTATEINDRFRNSFIAWVFPFF